MANEIFVVFVNSDSSLSPVRVLATNFASLADPRPMIMAKFRRPNTSGAGYFEDEYSGWPCFAIKRYQAKAGTSGGHTITRCREKEGPTPSEAREVHYDDDESNGRQVVWPNSIPQAAVGGTGVLLLGYDLDAPDWSSLLETARALNADDTPLT